MALIEVKDLNKLKSASAVKSVALSALDDQELQKVAYAINTAANTGATEITWLGDMRPATEAALKSQLYDITSYTAPSVAKAKKISWNK